MISSMKYQIDTAKKRLKKMREDLIRMYIEADSIEQFLVDAELKWPDAPSKMLRSFKLYHFKKEHPVIWPMLYMCFMCSLLIDILLLDIIPIVSIPIGIIMPIVIVWHMWSHVDLMQSIEWHENGCPRDY